MHPSKFCETRVLNISSIDPACGTPGTRWRIPSAIVARRYPSLCASDAHSNGSVETLAAGQRGRPHRRGRGFGGGRSGERRGRHRGKPELARACARAADYHGRRAQRRAVRRAAAAEGTGTQQLSVFIVASNEFMTHHVCCDVILRPRLSPSYCICIEATCGLH